MGTLSTGDLQDLWFFEEVEPYCVYIWWQNHRQ